ncbi:muts domain III-domain-containing protein, partial [Lasiosphaeria ovina]
PESSLDMLVNEFVAKGFKVARVDQMESALGQRDVRARCQSQKGRQDYPPRTSLHLDARAAAYIHSWGTQGGILVDSSMLQDDMATFCAAIKESVIDDRPAFGIAFVDAATGQFFISEFLDDIDLTKFETFVAQTSPRELLIERKCLSTKTLRILKNNTKFWEADLAWRKLDCGGYFVSDQGKERPWPKRLSEARDKDLLTSALGVLTQYLRVLKLERNLLSQGNFEWYSPIQRNGTLILDGQTLINLEISSNTANGGSEGSLFSLLDRCITLFGKRLFRQWVCHLLCNIQKINERLDVVDILNADRSLREQFTPQMTNMPDLACK